MRNSRLFVCLVAVVTGSGYGSDTFQSLSKGQSIHVTFHSRGCFHNVTYDFDFVRKKELTATIFRTETVWNEKEKKPVELKNEKMGAVTISKKDAIGLDKLVTFYGKHEEGGCTTIDMIKVVCSSDGKETLREDYLDETCATNYMEEVTTFRDLVGMLKPGFKKFRLKLYDPKEEMDKALVVCRKIPGWDQLQKSFKVERADLGMINSMPESLYVALKAREPKTLDSLRWWNPLEKGSPTLTWSDCLKAYADAESAMSKHSWVERWKNRSGKRSVGVNIFATKMGEREFELTNFILPVWNHVGLLGKPTHSIDLFSDNGWATVYFSDVDDRALILSARTKASGSDPFSKEADAIMKNKINLQVDLDDLDLSWHWKGKSDDNYSLFALIEGDGKCTVKRFVAEEK